jgi:hypothetical protein
MTGRDHIRGMPLEIGAVPRLRGVSQTVHSAGRADIC